MLAKDLLAKVRKIEIRTRRIVDELTAGAYLSVFKGRGIEFSEVREYTPGDDVRDIDWNVTARSGVAHIKKYAEEREMTVLLAVDVSRSCAFGSRAVEKKEKMAEAAALLALSAVRNHDKAGLLLFSDQPELYLPPKSGRTHVLRLIREMLAYEPKHAGTDLAAAMESLTRSLKKRAVIFVISDFASDQDYDRELKILAKRHDVIMIRVTDPLEHALPPVPGLELSDAENGSRFIFEPLRSHGAERVRRADQILMKKTEESARHAKVDMIELDANDDLVAPLMNFFRKRSARR